MGGAANHTFEVAALGDRQAVQIAARAVEAELDGAERIQLRPP